MLRNGAFRVDGKKIPCVGQTKSTASGPKQSGLTLEEKNFPAELISSNIYLTPGGESGSDRHRMLTFFTRAESNQVCKCCNTPNGRGKLMFLLWVPEGSFHWEEQGSLETVMQSSCTQAPGCM